MHISLRKVKEVKGDFDNTAGKMICGKSAIFQVRKECSTLKYYFKIHQQVKVLILLLTG